MNLASNPWSFTSSDVLTASIASSPTGLVLNSDGTVTLTTAAATTFAVGNGITIINPTATIYTGFYYCFTVTSTTVYQLVPQKAIPAGTAASGGGTAILNQYNARVRVEDMSWQNESAAGQAVDVRDRNGNVVWQGTSTGAGQQNRGKIFWIWGVSLNLLQSGVLLLTVN